MNVLIESCQRVSAQLQIVLSGSVSDSAALWNRNSISGIIQWYMMETESGSSSLVTLQIVVDPPRLTNFAQTSVWARSCGPPGCIQVPKCRLKSLSGARLGLQGPRFSSKWKVLISEFTDSLIDVSDLTNPLKLLKEGRLYFANVKSVDSSESQYHNWIRQGILVKPLDI